MVRFDPDADMAGATPFLSFPHGISGVVADVTLKPLGTIAWEWRRSLGFDPLDERLIG
jgi:hypothetical protein